jgi:hypothetical protein
MAQTIIDRRSRNTSDETDRALSEIINKMPNGSEKAILRRAVINQRWLK